MRAEAKAAAKAGAVACCFFFCSCPELVVPAGAQIECGADADCPVGFVCVDDAGLCVAEDSSCIVDRAAVDDGTPCARADGDGLCKDGQCLLAFCGDGVVDPTHGEECDDGDGNGNEPGACRFTCVPPSCGDGVVDPGEQCDSGGDTATDVAGAACHACGLQCLPGKTNPDADVDNGCEGDVEKLFSGSNSGVARFTVVDDILYHHDANLRTIETKNLTTGIIGTIATNLQRVNEMRASESHVYFSAGFGLSRMAFDGTGLIEVFDSFSPSGAYVIDGAEDVVYSWGPGNMSRAQADAADDVVDVCTTGLDDVCFADFVEYDATWLALGGGRLFALAEVDGTLFEINKRTLTARFLGTALKPLDSGQMFIDESYERQFAATSTHLYALGAADRRVVFEFDLATSTGRSIPLPAKALAVDADAEHAYVLMEEEPEAWVSVVVDGQAVPWASEDRTLQGSSSDQGRPHSLTVEGGRVLWSDTFSVYSVDAR